MLNQEIAATFNHLADLLEIEGANPFRVRAYRNAARTLSGLSEEVKDLLHKKTDLSTLPGIGKDLAQKIQTLCEGGDLPVLKEAEKKTPKALTQLLTLEGLGPKRVQDLHQKLQIRSITDLKKALKQHKIRELPGFGERLESRIEEALKHQEQYSKRLLLADAEPIAKTLLAYLKKEKAVLQVEVCGSYRRHKETVGDLDLILTSENPQRVMAHFLSFPAITEVLSRGRTRSTVHLNSGVQIDLRVMEPKTYGAALLYFTGSKEHNIRLRGLATQKGLKINEYGIFKGVTVEASMTEKAIYRRLGLPYIEPELRENHGEIEAGFANKLPTLVEEKALRGDLHAHTEASDGNASLKEMAEAAKENGLEYLAITDHSPHLRIAHGLSAAERQKQFKAIDRYNEKQKGFLLLKSAEIDILEDGHLDMPEALLKECDLTVCSIHSSFQLSARKQLDRLKRAMDNPYFTILAHPSGRLIGKRAPYEVDMEKVLEAAKERQVILEVDGQPERLDLNEIYCQRGKELGLKFSLASDAHSLAQLGYLRFAVYQARRGWLEKGDVVNCLGWAQLKKLIWSKR